MPHYAANNDGVPMALVVGLVLCTGTAGERLTWRETARGELAMKRPVTFYSEGCRLVGDIYYPDDLRPGEKRAGIVLCHGYTGVKDLYLPDNARVLNEAGYMVMTFDYKGWGESAGARSRLKSLNTCTHVLANPKNWWSCRAMATMKCMLSQPSAT